MASKTELVGKGVTIERLLLGTMDFMNCWKWDWDQSDGKEFYLSDGKVNARFFPRTGNAIGEAMGLWVDLWLTPKHNQRLTVELGSGPEASNLYNRLTHYYQEHAPDELEDLYGKILEIMVNGSPQ